MHGHGRGRGRGRGRGHGALEVAGEVVGALEVAGEVVGALEVAGEVANEFASAGDGAVALQVRVHAGPPAGLARRPRTVLSGVVARARAARASSAPSRVTR